MIATRRHLLSGLTAGALSIALFPTARAGTQTFEVTANGFRLEASASTASKAGVLNLVEG